MDVGYLANDDSLIFVGTTISTPAPNPPSVFYFNEGAYSSAWTDLNLSAYDTIPPTGVDYTPYSVGCAPDFATSKKTYVAVTNVGVPRTFVISTVGIVSDWTELSELCWNCIPGQAFGIRHASRFAFPDDFADTYTMFVGVAGTVTAGGLYDIGGDVYRIIDDFDPTTIALDLNVNPGLGGCTGLHANICSLDMTGDTDSGSLIAGALDETNIVGPPAVIQSPTDVYYSNSGGWTWNASVKDPTGGSTELIAGIPFNVGWTYVLFYEHSPLTAFAATYGCDCGFSMSCGDVVGQYFNQISLISMSIAEVLDLSFGPSYATGVETMYALTSAPGGCCCSDSFTLTATAVTTTITITETVPGTDFVSVTEFFDATANNIGITYDGVNVWTITLPDVGDTILVTALVTPTSITAASVNAPAYAAVCDCDTDLPAFVLGALFVMPDGAVIRSLLRSDGTFWERVHSSRSFDVIVAKDFVNAPLYDWVEQSPDFDDTLCVYLANTNTQMARSLDAGCSWRPLPFPCVDVHISAWIVVNESTVLTSGCGAEIGNVYRTTAAGSQPWKEYKVYDCDGLPATCGVDFDISPDVEADNNVLLGDDFGYVYLSTDLGETWTEVRDALTGPFNDILGVNTYVVFDPGYATADDPGENTIYAAAGTEVGRCTVNFDTSLCFQDWLYLSANTLGVCDAFGLKTATGIAIEGDPALYVSDLGGVGGTAILVQIAASGTIQITGDTTAPAVFETVSPAADITITPTFGTFTNGEPVLIIGETLAINAAATLVEGPIQVQGAWSGAIGVGTFSAAVAGGVFTASETVTVMNAALTITVAGTGATETTSGVWRTVNPLAFISEDSNLNLVEWEFLGTGLSTATTPPASALRHPEADAFAVYPDDLWLTSASNVLWALDAGNLAFIWAWKDPLATQVVQVSPADGTLLATSDRVTIEWEALDAATLYEFKLYEDCPECLSPTKMFEVTLTTNTTANTCITIPGLTPGTKYFWKVRVACDSPYVSKWSDLRSFDTALSTIAVLCSPICGASDIIPTTNFSWDPVVGATGYELQIVAASADGTADFTGATTYSSDVNALASIPGLEYSTVYYWRVRAVKDGIAGAWSVCLFTIMDVPAEPVDAITPVTIVTEEITPVWIWVIIGIGGALTIVVIILIVTTRKVS